MLDRCVVCRVSLVDVVDVPVDLRVDFDQTVTLIYGRELAQRLNLVILNPSVVQGIVVWRWDVTVNAVEAVIVMRSQLKRSMRKMMEMMVVIALLCVILKDDSAISQL